ncbi:MAG: LPS export ABC transporter periplasmic protein LptC [Proteobacteria bacterium]|nr:LPS export ABC transporter periplasmic protein LptC [Pseudomonadota bacterium]
MDSLPESIDVKTARAPITVTPMESRAKPAHYSRFVSWMKLLLPVTALVLMVVVVVWPQVHGIEAGLPLGFGQLKLTDTDDPNMVNARFVGADEKNQPFSITADLAKNILQGSSAVDLEMPKADIAIKDGSSLVLTANTGVFDKDAKVLDLAGSVNLFHDSGYEFNTESARIDLGLGVATGHKAIDGQGPFGSLEAEGFRMSDRGKTMYFTGKSKLVINPGAEEPK